MDRRALFFASAGLVSLLLAWPSDPELRWVPLVLAALYAVLSLASYLDFRSQQRSSAGEVGPGNDDGPGQPNRPVM